MKTISLFFDVVKGKDSDTLWANFARAIQENSKKFPSIVSHKSSCTKVRETDTTVTYFWEKIYKEKGDETPLLPEKTKETTRVTSIVTKFRYDNRTEYKNQFGQLHREDGPALVTNRGDKYWYKNGQLHREYGAAIEYMDGTRCWYKEGKLHREYGPAVESPNGTKNWYKDGLLHRDYGPAVESARGDREYWKNGVMQSSYVSPYSTSAPTSTRFTEGCLGSVPTSSPTIPSSTTTHRTRSVGPRNSETSLEIVYNLEGEIIETNKGV